MLFNPKRSEKKPLEYLGGNFVEADKDKSTLLEKASSIEGSFSAAFVYTGKVKKLKNTVICL